MKGHIGMTTNMHAVSKTTSLLDVIYIIIIIIIIYLYIYIYIYIYNKDILNSPDGVAILV